MRVILTETARYYQVQFPYNRHAIEEIKTIPGRVWVSAEKAWHVPLSEGRSLVRFVQRWGGTGETAPAVSPVPRLSAGEEANGVVPTCTKTQPWAHQLACLRWMWHRDAALIDMIPGSGKSRILVDFVLNHPGIRRVLILCPLSFVWGWPAQFAQHGGKPIVAACLDSTAGTVAQRTVAAQRCVDEGQRRNCLAVVVINYDAVWRAPFAEWALDAGFDVVAADEIQMLRSAGSKRSRYAYRLGRTIPIRIGLSGTPFPESPLDVYGVCRYLDPSLFGTRFDRFRQQYACVETYGGFPKVVGFQRQEEMRAKIDTLRFMMAPEGYALPEVVDIDISVTLPKPAQDVYATLARDFYAKVGAGEITIANAAVAVTKLQEVTSGFLPVHRTEKGELSLEIEEMHTEKHQALQDLLESLPPTEPVVVFCRFHRDLAAVHTVATHVGRKSAEISGRPGRPALQLVGGKWQDGPETVLAVQGSAGVEGVDLSRACRAIYFSYVWELGKYEQSRKRIHRAGQTRPCFYYHLCMKNTVDTRIRMLLERKQHVLEALLHEKEDTL